MIKDIDERINDLTLDIGEKIMFRYGIRFAEKTIKRCNVVALIKKMAKIVYASNIFEKNPGHYYSFEISSTEGDIKSGFVFMENEQIYYYRIDKDGNCEEYNIEEMTNGSKPKYFNLYK